MNLKKVMISGILGITIFAGSIGIGYGQDINYRVAAGDTFWIISQKYNVSMDSLMKANNADEKTVLAIGQNLVIPTDEIYIVQGGDTYWIISQKYGVDLQTLMKINNATDKTVLNMGDQIIIPQKNQITQEQTYMVQPGDSYWMIAQKHGINIKDLLTYNGANEKTVLYVGQKIKIPQSDTTSIMDDQSKPYITYTSYKVQQGDDLWKVALKFGIPYSELLTTNNMNEGTTLYIGDLLKIPVHHVPVMTTPGEKYGEVLDWWTQAQYVLPVGAVFKVVDFNTGKSFMAKRTTGANHADVETLTISDTKVMKEIWGGTLDWDSRPVIIEYNGRKLAASAASMPHAGNDSAPGGVYTSWRSGGYGGGYNFDWVKNNGIDGVFDIHFKNSTRHKDSQVDMDHQENIKTAGGIK